MSKKFREEYRRRFFANVKSISIEDFEEKVQDESLDIVYTRLNEVLTYANFMVWSIDDLNTIETGEQDRIL
ncbi:hypothetical protein [Clostridioides sp. ZZV14-6345]|uniref:hypothetical protein n=1 Tax=Clostridioides sp. ZZV14-6345 TaxID=2811496 RepID=UPI001D10BB8D|nr:hypothetical protein [Clostridioides sp. ZZV14-6345]